MPMSRCGLSLEELRIVEGQGQSSEVITPSEEMNRMNDMGREGLHCRGGQRAAVSQAFLSAMQVLNVAHRHRCPF